MKKVLLLNPPGKFNYTRDYFCSKVAKTNYAEHPIDLLILSGFLNSEHSLQLIDAIAQKLSFEDTYNCIEAIELDAIIFLTGTTSWVDDFPFLQKIKKERPHIKLIGLGDLFRDDKVFRANRWIDAVILDFTTNDVLQYLKGRFDNIKAMMLRDDNNRIIIRKQKEICEFNIPIPRHELFLKFSYSFPFARHLPFTTILTDYGCPFNCRFCIYGTLGFKVRSLKNVFAELDHISDLKIKELFIKDQSFGANKKRTLELCQGMARDYNFSWTCFLRTDLVSDELLSAMKSAGCHTVMLGVESANERVLRKYKPGINKQNIRQAFQLCRQLKIDTVGIFILGFPEDDEESCRQTINFALELGCNFASFNIFVPKLDTPVRNEMGDDLLLKEKEVMDQSGIASIHGSKNLSGEQLYNLRKLAIRKFYLRPSYILKKLIRIHSLHELRMLKSSAVHLLREVCKKTKTRGA